MTDLRTRLSAICPADDSNAAREAVAGDKSGLRARADIVVRTRTTEEVAAILRVANELRVPVVARAAGTGRVGGAVPVHGGIVLDMMGMDRLLELDVAESIVRAQPGLKLGDLQDAVRREGLYFPPDPASARDCAVGGAIAMSAGGLTGAKYGTMKHYVLALEVVLASGEVIRTGARTRKCVTGYDLTSLMVGSEGTLGIVTEATLRLIPAPETSGTLACWFDDEASARAGVDAALRVAAVPRALEFVDGRALGAVAAYRSDEAMAKRAALLLVECDGAAAAVDADLTRFEAALSPIAALVERAGADTAERLWEARRGVSPAVTARWPERFSEDICVPRTRFVEMLGDLQTIAASHGLSALGFGHAGDGNIHASVLMERGDEEERARGKRAVADVFRRALELGGTLSAEHGIALTKREFLPLELSEANRAAQVAIKRALDPNGILNPGKIFP